MSSEALEKTFITNNWQIFSKKLYQHFINHKKILKVTKFQFKIVCRSKVIDKSTMYPSPNPPTPGANRVKIHDALWLKYSRRFLFIPIVAINVLLCGYRLFQFNLWHYDQIVSILDYEIWKNNFVDAAGGSSFLNWGK